MNNPTSLPPRRLAFAVGCVAAAMLLVELFVTRLFSVLFFYHFSFFAISLVMSGLVIGGIAAARWDAHRADDAVFDRRMATLAWVFAATTLAAVWLAVVVLTPGRDLSPSLGRVALYALIFLPGLVAAGAFLASAFARREEWIGSLYASDLIAAAVACAAAVFLMRTVQGPTVFLCPVLLAAGAGLALSVGPGAMLHRIASGAVAVVAIAMLVAGLVTGGRFLRLRSDTGAIPIFERWNEHSRIQAFDWQDKGRFLVIDKTAATFMKEVRPEPDGTPPRSDPSWTWGAQYIVYSLGRQVDDVAIIGVGGGGDLLPALANGAAHVDGYELNGILAGLLERDFRDYNAIATRPEVRLVHDEARVGISRSGKQYDVIQASLIDTWAATASGGFVLSENGLYTREGWRTFLSHLSDRGVLTMSRWYLPDAPAETERLVALAAAGIQDAGIADPRAHIMLVGSGRDNRVVAFTSSEIATMATILVSKTPFTPDEIARIRARCDAEGMELLAAPGATSPDPTIDRLLDPASRQAAIDASPYNISPPSDLQPYFFLQVRPSDLVNLSRNKFGSVTEITFNGVRVVMILGACALVLVFAVALLTAFGLPGTATAGARRSAYRWMTLYFLGIGFGYILVQLSLHQRLIIVLGHPTFALSVVLFAMLLGTGIGSAVSSRLFPSGRPSRAGLAILATLVVLWLALPLVSSLEHVGSMALRLGIAGLLIGAVGLALGLAFPLGARAVSRTGEWAVQKMWAVNGAASIAGSVIAAFVGFTAGSGAVLAAGVLFYAVATAAAWTAEAEARDVDGGEVQQEQVA